MKIPSVALTALLATKSADAFAPQTTFANVRTFTSSGASHDIARPPVSTTECGMVSGGFLGDEIKPPNRMLDDEDAPVPDDVQQPLTPSQRKDNLNEIRNLQNVEIEDAKRYSNYEGFVNGRKKLKERKAKDPWFKINEALRKAVVMGDDAEADRLKKLVDQVGGPPGDIKTSKKPYATFDEVMDIGISPARLEMEIKRERAKKNRLIWQESMKKREESEKKNEEIWGDPYESAEMEKKKERSMRFLYAKLEERRKKEQEKLKKYIDEAKASGYGTEEEEMTPLDRALAAANKAAAEAKAKREGKPLPSSTSSSDDAIDTTASSASLKKTDDNRIPGDTDIARGEISADTIVSDSSKISTNGLCVEVSSEYNAAQSDPTMRKHCFTYTVRITNESDTDTIQLASRRFEIQTIGTKQKDIVEGKGVTGKTPVLKPGETFEYTSTAPLSVRPIGTTPVAARMEGEYAFDILGPDGKPLTTEVMKAKLGTFHFIFPEDQRVKPVLDSDDTDEDSSSNEVSTENTFSEDRGLPGDADMASGKIAKPYLNSSEAVCEGVRVEASSEYRPERSNPLQNKLCFAYNIRITNESSGTVQLVSRRFEIQTIGSDTKDVVQGPGVTGRQPILKPGESFEYTSTAPLNVDVDVMQDMENNEVAARMQGEYSFVKISEDGSPLSSTPLQAKLAMFHFIIGKEE